MPRKKKLAEVTDQQEAQVAEQERPVQATPSTGDDDPALRPKRLVDFDGQPRVRQLLEISIAAALQREETLDHTLLYGPPGLGKTTLANIIANEMDRKCRAVSAPAIQRPGDLASILVGLDDGDVFFIDEIHRLAPIVEEVLYSAMEDFRLDITTGEPGRSERISLKLPRFTLVAATTRSGMLQKPLRERFGLDLKLELYNQAALSGIVRRSAKLLGIHLGPGVDIEIAARSRGTPRVANRLLRRVRDAAQHAGSATASMEIAEAAFSLLEVDRHGLDSLDRRYLECLRDRFKGRPVGIDTIAAALGEDSGTLEDQVEPWLVQQGLVDRTPRGRQLSQSAHGPEFGATQARLL